MHSSPMIPSSHDCSSHSRIVLASSLDSFLFTPLMILLEFSCIPLGTLVHFILNNLSLASIKHSLVVFSSSSNYHHWKMNFLEILDLFLLQSTILQGSYGAPNYRADSDAYQETAGLCAESGLWTVMYK